MSAAGKALNRSDNNHYSKTIEGRKEWREREGQIRTEFGIDLAVEFLPGAPVAITDRVFSMAWEEGHSEGYQQVADRYDELGEFVIFIRSQV